MSEGFFAANRLTSPDRAVAELLYVAGGGSLGVCRGWPQRRQTHPHRPKTVPERVNDVNDVNDVSTCHGRYPSTYRCVPSV